MKPTTPPDSAVAEAATLRRNPPIAETVRGLLRELGRGSDAATAEAIVAVLAEAGLSFGALHTLLTAVPRVVDSGHLWEWHRLRLPDMRERWCRRGGGWVVLTVR